MERGGENYYYHYDGLGSVVNITDSTGAKIESYEYDAYGQPTIYDSEGNQIQESSIQNRFMFTGREYDAETELYYYRSRYYSPTLGRFLTKDPLQFLYGPNNYLYCYNNPINYTDPEGLAIVFVHGIGRRQTRPFAKRLASELIKRGITQDFFSFDWGPANFYNFGSKTTAYASKFANFVANIRKKYGTSEPINIFTHSAGADLVNKALKNGLKVDNVIIAGAPTTSNDFTPLIEGSRQVHSFESARDVVNFWISGWWNDMAGITYHGYAGIRHGDWTEPWNIKDRNKQESILSAYAEILSYGQ